MPRGRGSPQGCGGTSRQAGVVGPTSKPGGRSRQAGTDPKRLWNLPGIWVGPCACGDIGVTLPTFLRQNPARCVMEPHIDSAAGREAMGTQERGRGLGIGVIGLALLFFAACGDKEENPQGLPTSAADTADTATIQGDSGSAPDLGGEPDAPPAAELPIDVSDDTGAETEWPSYFGKPCDANEDCKGDGEEGWCLRVGNSDEKSCTVTCVETCPEGYGCAAVQNPGGSDALFVCTLPTDPACKPCTADDDCPPSVPCVVIGLDGGEPDLRCAPPCEPGTAGACGVGFSCQAATGAGGESQSACLPDTGSCICFGVDDAGEPIDGATRPCMVQSEIGTCFGIETCAGAAGWSGCSAPEPAPEACNDGVDDDCDGVTDEEDAIGCSSFYPDLDHDDYGEVDAPARCLCAPTGDYTAALTGDCVDSDGTIHPGAPEVCNLTDDDCSGTADDGDPGGGEACDPEGACLLGQTECVEGKVVCSANAPVPLGQDPHEECEAKSCQESGYYFGWVDGECYGNAAVWGGACNGQGACAAAAQACESSPVQGATTGLSRPSCHVAEGCKGYIPPATSPVTAGEDPWGDCPDAQVCSGDGSCCWGLGSFVGDWFYALTSTCDDKDFYWWYGCTELSGSEWDGVVDCSFLQTQSSGETAWCDFQITRKGCNAFHSAGECDDGYKFAEDYAFTGPDSYEATYFDTIGCGEYTAKKVGCFELDDLLGTWSVDIKNSCKGESGTAQFECTSVVGDDENAFAACTTVVDGENCTFPIKKVGCNGFQSDGLCSNGYSWLEYIAFESKTQAAAHWPWDSAGNCGSWTGTRTPPP